MKRASIYRVQQFVEDAAQFNSFVFSISVETVLGAEETRLGRVFGRQLEISRSLTPVVAFTIFCAHFISVKTDRKLIEHQHHYHHSRVN